MPLHSHLSLTIQNGAIMNSPIVLYCEPQIMIANISGERKQWWLQRVPIYPTTPYLIAIKNNSTFRPYFGGYHMNFVLFPQLSTHITWNQDLSYFTEGFPRTQDFQCKNWDCHKLGWLVNFLMKFIKNLVTELITLD